MSDNYALATKLIKAPLMYNSVAYNGYGVHKETGDVYSRLVGGEWRMRKPGTGGNMKYPFAGITGDDGKTKAISWHKACIETLKPKKPSPLGVSKSDWARTPLASKLAFNQMWQVNHIDHDHSNFSPDNLEWVTVRENADKYQIHRVTSKRK